MNQNNRISLTTIGFLHLLLIVCGSSHELIGAAEQSSNANSPQKKELLLKELQETANKITHFEQLIASTEKQLDKIKKTYCNLTFSYNNQLSEKQKNNAKAEFHRVRAEVQESSYDPKKIHEFFKKEFFNDYPSVIARRVKFLIVREAVQYRFLQEYYYEYENHIKDAVRIQDELIKNRG